MTQKDASAFQKEIEVDESIYCFIEEGVDHHESEPPVKLKNPRLFKPFEMYVKMYGLPSYNEMDPTIFVGLTYSLIFGAMFGDVGQGLLLLIGGALLYHFKRSPWRRSSVWRESSLPSLDLCSEVCLDSRI